MTTVENDFGKRLTAAREARKLSVEEAAYATRMRPSHIAALESGNLSSFANAAYAKSFLVMYARFLEVDVSDTAKAIDTTTQVGVSDFQYLASRAEDDKEFQRAAADSRYDFVVPKRESRSWLPLIGAGALTAIAALVFVVWMNLSRIADEVPASQTTLEPAPPTEAVQPVENGATPAPAVAAVPAKPAAPPAAEQAAPVAPRPAVIAGPNGAAPVAAPVQGNDEPEIPRARPISPVASIAANDGALLAEIPAPAKPAVGTAAPRVSEVSVDRDDADVVLLDPRKKTWVVIRSGPGGQPLFEDYLYPGTRPMRLPPGKYYIELKEADAVSIVRNGKRISYVAPGVLVQ